MNDTGFHTLWDISGVAKGLLQDATTLHAFFKGELLNAGFTVLNDVIHKFDSGGEGVTGLFLLSESHLSYHTYPETHYISIDVYTCGHANASINATIYKHFEHATSLHRVTLTRGSCPPLTCRGRHETHR